MIIRMFAVSPLGGKSAPVAINPADVSSATPSQNADQTVLYMRTGRSITVDHNFDTVVKRLGDPEKAVIDVWHKWVEETGMQSGTLVEAYSARVLNALRGLA